MQQACARCVSAGTMQPRLVYTAAQLAGAVRSEFSHAGSHHSSLCHHVTLHTVRCQAFGLPGVPSGRGLRHTAWLPVATSPTVSGEHRHHDRRHERLGSAARGSLHIARTFSATTSSYDMPRGADGMTPEDITRNADVLQQAADKRELHAVNVAVCANSLIFVAKMAAWCACGGSALLAEAIHSLADIGNQALLRLGITKAQRAPTPEYPYGFARDKFVFSLISAVGIFCIGAGASIFNGIGAIMEPAAHGGEHLFWGIAVLLFSTLIEGFSLYVAVNSVRAGAHAAGMTFLNFVKAGRDPTSIAIMMEDGAAVAGLLVAAMCTKLAEVTGFMAWDGVGSVLVGFILAGVAMFLIQKNRSLLIGRSMAEADFERVIALLQRDPVVKNIYEAMSEEIGPGIYRFKAEINFDGPMLIERYMMRHDEKRIQQDFAAAALKDNNVDLQILLKDYGTEIVSAVGAEIDRIEADIQCINPGIKYVDLETDRGRFYSYKTVGLKKAGGQPKPESANGTSNGAHDS